MLMSRLIALKLGLEACMSGVSDVKGSWMGWNRKVEEQEYLN